MKQKTDPTGREVFFEDDELIVSKTDKKGRITYANKTFIEISGFTENELVGQPHSLIRHPDMPRSVFKLLWDTLEAGSEIFAYVINQAKNGDHYWVFAHATPSFGRNGEIIGYHSTRRVPERKVLEDTIIPLYRQLKSEEQSHHNRKDGLNSSLSMVTALLAENNMAYDEFVMGLARA